MRFSAGQSLLPVFSLFAGDHSCSRWPTASHPTSWSGASANRASVWRQRSVVRAQYVGIRAPLEPALSIAGERLPDRMPGLLCSISLRKSCGSQRFGAVTQCPPPAQTVITTVAATHRHISAWRTGWRIEQSITTSASAWILFPTADSSPFPREAFYHLCQETWIRDYGPCDYDIRHNFNAQYVYQLPIKVRNPHLGIQAERLAALWDLIFWHSGIPFSVFSTPYSANGNGIVQGGGPQFASVVPGVPALRAQPDSWRDAAWLRAVAQSERLYFGSRSEYRCVRGAADNRAKLSNLAVSGAMLCAVLISSGATSTLPNLFR